MKSKNKLTILFATLFFLVPAYVQAQDFSYIALVAGLIMNSIQMLVPLLLAIGLAVFVWGLVVFIAKADNEQERAAGKQKMVWGIVGLFVLTSVWGLVLLVQELTGIDNDDAGSLGPPGIPFP